MYERELFRPCSFPAGRHRSRKERERAALRNGLCWLTLPIALVPVSGEGKPRCSHLLVKALDFCFQWKLRSCDGAVRTKGVRVTMNLQVGAQDQVIPADRKVTVSSRLDGPKEWVQGQPLLSSRAACATETYPPSQKVKKEDNKQVTSR